MTGGAEPTGALPTVYGLRVATPLPLRHRLVTTGGAPDVVVEDGPPPPLPDTTTLLWESPERLHDGTPTTRLLRRGRWEVLRFGGEVDFYLAPKEGGAQRVVAVPEPGTAPEVVELRLLGPVLAYHLERCGVVALHASAVAVDGRAAAFLAGNHGGKTNLAVTLMEGGAPLLTDDVLPVEEVEPGFRAHPGYPEIRLWVRDAARFGLARAADLPTVHPAYDKRIVPVGEGGLGSFRCEPCPLAALYLPQRRADLEAPRTEAVAPANAVLALIAGSYLPRLVVGAGLQGRRLERLARLVERVPVRRLVLPEGPDRLPEVVPLIRGEIAP